MGTAYHKIFESIDFALERIDEVYLAALTESLRQNSLIDEAQLRHINLGRVLGFVNTELGERFRTAAKGGYLRREQPFVMGVPASETNPDFPEDETVLIQGIIDALWEEEDGFVIVDFKTDNVRSLTELRKRYALQLGYYARAVERAFGKRVKEALIYSVELGEVLRM